jgi:hypothetical protein
MSPIRPQTLNNVFQQAANQARQKSPELSHNQKVCFVDVGAVDCSFYIIFILFGDYFVVRYP